MNDPLSHIGGNVGDKSVVTDSAKLFPVRTAAQPNGSPQGQTTNHPADHPSGATQSLTPGQLLRAARDRMRINLEEMVTSLRLPLATLDALERDDFKTLSQPVYVRGYYRRCARLLDIDEADLLTAYDRLAPKPPTALSNRILLGEEEPSTRWPIRSGLLLLALLLALVVSILVWLHHAQLSQNTLTSTADAPVATIGSSAPALSGAAISETPPEAPSGAPSPSAASRSPVAESAADKPPRATVYDSLAQGPAASGLARGISAGAAGAGANTVANVSPRQSQPHESEPLPDASEPAKSTIPVNAQAVPRLPGPPVGNEAAVAGEGDVGGRLHQLVLKVRSTSWLRVEDSTGKLLFVGTIYGGNTQTLSGRPPYQLFIGYAPGVDIEYAGQSVDVAPHIRENATARISVPDAGTTASNSQPSPETISPTRSQTGSLSGRAPDDTPPSDH